MLEDRTPAQRRADREAAANRAHGKKIRADRLAAGGRAATGAGLALTALVSVPIVGAVVGGFSGLLAGLVIGVLLAGALAGR